jgi:hypothetical protein
LVTQKMEQFLIRETRFESLTAKLWQAELERERNGFREREREREGIIMKGKQNGTLKSGK